MHEFLSKASNIAYVMKELWTHEYGVWNEEAFSGNDTHSIMSRARL